MEYRGLYDNKENNNEQRYFEFGAHFKYSDLVRELKVLQESQSIKKEKNSNSNNNNNNINSNNSNYNELYNQINKQLCQKMTDIISPNKLIQSRNIKPLIQSLSHKLTDIVQSQNNKKSLKHNVTKNKYINSNCSTKQKMKNNIINISNSKNNGCKNINLNNNNNNIIIKNKIKGAEQNFIDVCPTSSKPQDFTKSRNYLNNKNKNTSSKNNLKNLQQSLNKKNNVTSQEIKYYKNIQNKMQKSGKNINDNFDNNNNEIIYGAIIENNNINNSNNKQNAQTVQNIIVKPNINISFINNFNTTFLRKNKKRSPKKVRSRNNPEIAKLNVIENQIFNINNNFQVQDGGNDENNVNNIIYQNNNDSNSKNNKNKIDLIFLQKNNDKINLKEIHTKSNFISPKMKIKSNNGKDKQNAASCNNRNAKMNTNINNNFLNKEQKQDNNIIQEKLTRNINKKIAQNIQNKNKINKTANEINQINILNNGNLINNYINYNYSQNKNGKLNNNNLNINNNNSQQDRLSYINSLNDSKKKNLVIRNIVLSNHISDKKKGQNKNNLY